MPVEVTVSFETGWSSMVVLENRGWSVLVSNVEEEEVVEMGGAVASSWAKVGCTSSVTVD